MSRISALFTADASGLKAGSAEASRAMAKLRGDVSAMKSSMDSLKNLVGVQTFALLGRMATDAARGLISMASSSAAAIDSLSKLATRTGRTYEEMASLEMAGNLAGVGVDKLAGALTRSDRMFDAARSGSQQAQSAFARLGLDMEELGNMSSQQRFEAIAAAIAQLPDPAARAAVAMQIFGRSGVEMLPMFGGISEAMEQARIDAERFGLALSSGQGQNVEAMNDSITRAGYAMQGLVTQVVAQLSPAVKEVVDWFTGLFELAGGETIGTAIVDAFWNAGEILARAVDLMSAAVSPIIEGFASVFTYFGEAAGLFGGSIDGWALATEMFQRAISLFEGIAKAFVAGFQAIIGAFAKIGEWILGAIASAVEMIGYSSATLREMQVNAGREGDAMLNSAIDWGNAAGENVANAFSYTFQPTQLGQDITNGMTGGSESMVERWRAEQKAANDAAKKAAEDTGKAASDSMSAGLAGSIGKLAEGLQANSVEGRKEMLRLMYGGGDSVQEKQLKEQRESNQHLEGINESLDNLDVGVEAFGF